MAWAGWRGGPTKVYVLPSTPSDPQAGGMRSPSLHKISHIMMRILYFCASAGVARMEGAERGGAGRPSRRGTSENKRAAGAFTPGP